MNKVSQEEVIKLAAEAPAMIRQLTAERDDALAKLAQFEQRVLSEKLAEEMHEKGINQHVSISDLADQLDAAAAQGKFAEVRRAVDLVGPDMGQKIAERLRGDENNDSDTPSTGGERVFLDYLTS